MDQHFFPERKKEIRLILDEFGFENILLTSYNRLLGLRESNGGSELLVSPVFNTTISATLYNINQGLRPITDVAKRNTVKKAVTEITIRLVFEFIRELEVELIEAAPVFDKVVQTLCVTHGYKYEDFQQDFNLSGVVSLSQDLSGTAEVKKQRATRKNTISWQVGNPAEAELDKKEKGLDPET